MANVIVDWGTSDQAIPGAASFTKFRVIVGSNSVVLPLTERTYTFANVSPGTYPVKVELLSTDEITAGPSVSDSVTVPVPAATAPVPVNITVTLG